MTRNELKDFIQLPINDLNPSVEYDCGRLTQLNQFLQKIGITNFHFIWLVSPGTKPGYNDTMTVLFDNWTVQLHIGKLDKMDSSLEEYEAIIDECDMLARKLLNQYNLQLEESPHVTITGIGIDPFIKLHAVCSTGVILSFTLNAPDLTSLC